MTASKKEVSALSTVKTFNDLARRAADKGSETLSLIWKAGETAKQAKKSVPHGEWMKFVDQFYDVSHSTVTRWVQFHETVPESKLCTVHNLTAGIKMLDPPQEASLDDDAPAGKLGVTPNLDSEEEEAPTIKLHRAPKKAAKKKKRVTKPPKKLDRKAYYNEWTRTIGPLIRLVSKIGHGVDEHGSAKHTKVKKHLQNATDAMGEWMEGEVMAFEDQAMTLEEWTEAKIELATSLRQLGAIINDLTLNDSDPYGALDNALAQLCIDMTNNLFTVDPWPHQLAGVEQTIDALSNGTDSLCLTSPTGSGKTAMMVALTNWALHNDQRVVLFTNRILLTQQTRRVFRDAGVSAGVVSASMPEYEYDGARVQIATMQTILARRRANDSYWLDAELVLVDEVHQQASGESADVLNEYKERGAKVCGITATPLGVSNVCDELIVAGRTRDLQDDNILCFARWFAPSELDTHKLVNRKIDLSLSENDARRTWGPLRGREKQEKSRTRIVGNILGHYHRLHEAQTHTIAFAPGVKESLWAAQFCNGRGIRALHIDGQDFWCDGEMYDRKAHDAEFQGFMEEWRAGDIPIIWNRFVLREGIDEPQIKCIMLATPVGSYRSFLQMVGRGLRTHGDKPDCLVLDFGGAWWRHGSVNVNVDWEDVFECDDPDVLSKNRIAQIRETGESVGQACPKCGMVHQAFERMIHCQHCGHKMFRGKASRPILQSDGTLEAVNGEPIEQWKIKMIPDNADRWKGLYWNAVKKFNGEKSFNELYAQFGYTTARDAGTNGSLAWWHAYYPPRDLPLMPRDRNDWHLKVADVPRENLY